MPSDDYTERELRELRENLERTELALEKMLKDNKKTQERIARLLKLRPKANK